MVKIERFEKKVIAFGFLETAIKLNDEKDFFGALHLAGASEEIFGQCLVAKGVENSLESEVKAFVAVSKVLFKADITEKFARDFINGSKNSIKHMNGLEDNFVELDPEEAARGMIIRTLTNLWRLEEITPNLEEYWRKLEAEVLK